MEFSVLERGTPTAKESQQYLVRGVQAGRDGRSSAAPRTGVMVFKVKILF
jgi:hypothetical protein